MIDTREVLHQLVDELPDAQLEPALRMLEKLRPALTDEALDEILANAPMDDEEYTEEELRSIEEGLKDASAGRVISNAELADQLKLRPRR